MKKASMERLMFQNYKKKEIRVYQIFKHIKGQKPQEAV